MFEEKIEYAVTITARYILEIRKTVVVYRDGNEFARQHHRYMKAPGDNICNEPKMVRDIANSIWTRQIIEDYRSSAQENFELEEMDNGQKEIL